MKSFLLSTIRKIGPPSLIKVQGNTLGNPQASGTSFYT